MNSTQKYILDIFKEIAKICDNNNIPYYATYGTCLGAVRHKGFIPWDDDLDITIPIEHYFRFIDVAKQQLPSNLYLFTPQNVQHYHYMWYKVCNRDTTFIENSEFAFPDAYKGVFVDITPISGVPKEETYKVKFIKELRVLHTLNDLRRFPNTSCGNVNRKMNSIIKSFLCLFPLGFFATRYLNVLKRNSFSKSQYTGHTWHPYELKTIVFPKEWMGEGVMLDFEDTQIRCPINYHNYLTLLYGDYMQLPPVEQRQTHNGFVDLEKSFEHYKHHGLPEKN